MDSCLRYWQEIDSPVGELLLVGTQHALTRVHFQAGPQRLRPRQEWQHAPDPFVQTRSQLIEYFCGARRSFELPLAPEGTAFQLSVWRELGRIPYGETLSYAQLARRLGLEKGARAVGLANGANPLPIVVPCHRVIGADGTLTGFGGGLHIKRSLLTLEGAACVMRDGSVHRGGAGRSRHPCVLATSRVRLGKSPDSRKAHSREQTRMTPTCSRPAAALAIAVMLVPPPSGAANRSYIEHPVSPGSAPLPFSDAVRSGDTLYVAGHIGLDPHTGNAPADPAVEARLVMEAVKHTVESAGLTMDDLVSVTVYCTDLQLYDTFNTAYRTYFHNHYPARAFIGSGKLLREGHFEVQGVAIKGSP